MINHNRNIIYNTTTHTHTITCNVMVMAQLQPEPVSRAPQQPHNTAYEYTYAKRLSHLLRAA